MDLVASVRKEGSRGGRADFKWSDVQTDQHRENYLGHSLMAPVGRWQKGRDLSWYAKADDNGDEASAAERAKQERLAEIKRIKEAEQDALSRALGFPVDPTGPLGSGTGANAVAVAPKMKDEDTSMKGDDQVVRKVEKRRRDRSRGKDRDRDRDRDHDRNRERKHRRHHRHHHSRSRSSSRSRSVDHPSRRDLNRDYDYDHDRKHRYSRPPPYDERDGEYQRTRGKRYTEYHYRNGDDRDKMIKRSRYSRSRSRSRSRHRDKDRDRDEGRRMQRSRSPRREPRRRDDRERSRERRRRDWSPGS